MHLQTFLYLLSYFIIILYNFSILSDFQFFSQRSYVRSFVLLCFSSLRLNLGFVNFLSMPRFIYFVFSKRKNYRLSCAFFVRKTRVQVFRRCNEKIEIRTSYKNYGTAELFLVVVQTHFFRCSREFHVCNFHRKPE